MNVFGNTHIVLCGLPGVGKTTVGESLGCLLARKFIDIDCLIEEKCLRSCREYYRVEGEEPFRKLEKEILVSLRGTAPAIIALGGGAVEIVDAARIIPPLGVIVHLVEDMEELIRRKIIKDNPAPASDKAAFEQLAARRLPLLREIAAIEIRTTGKNRDALSREIVEKLRYPFRGFFSEK